MSNFFAEYCLLIMNSFPPNIVCLSVSIDCLIIGSKTIAAAVVHNWWTIKLIDEDH